MSNNDFMISKCHILTFNGSAYIYDNHPDMIEAIEILTSDSRKDESIPAPRFLVKFAEGGQIGPATIFLNGKILP